MDSVPEVLAEEQKYFDHVSDQRERMRRGLLDAPAAAAHAGAAVHLRKDAETRLRRIGDPDDAVAVGRMDHEDGDVLYVGHHTIFDEDSEVLVVNWQAPAAARYYTATHADPGGLVRKRTFECDGNTIESYSEVVFQQLAAAVAELEEPGDALLDDLNRDRTGQMQDIVRTIQAAQFDLIRAPLDELLVIQGGPGTGKTAVALHRISWLLFNHRDALAAQDVLIVGPTPTFTRYTRTVLPSLGDSSVVQRDIGQFHPPVRRGRAEEPEAVRLKGDGRLAGLLRRALYDRVGVPAGQPPVEAHLDGRPVVLTADEINQIVERARQTPGTFTQQRQIFRSLMVNVGLDRARERRLGVRTPLDQLIERLWPSFTAAAFLRELFGSRDRLAAAAGEHFTTDEIALLHRRAGDRITEEVWSEADLPLLDHLETLIHGLDERYAHIVVDEAQDLSPMQLRSIAARSSSGSMTVVGDIAQSTGRWARDDWDDVLEHLPAQLTPRIAELRYGYRVPRQVFELAERLLPIAAPGITAPLVVRDGPADPVLRLADDGNRAATAVEAAMAHASHGRSVAIICPAVHRGAVESELTARDVAWRAASRSELGQGVNLVSPQEAKGLEFDATVVVEPRDIVAEDERGHRLLYVALTRTTRYLHVIGVLPPIAGGGPFDLGGADSTADPGPAELAPVSDSGAAVTAHDSGAAGGGRDDEVTATVPEPSGSVAELSVTGSAATRGPRHGGEPPEPTGAESRLEPSGGDPSERSGALREPAPSDGVHDFEPTGPVHEPGSSRGGHRFQPADPEAEQEPRDHADDFELTGTVGESEPSRGAGDFGLHRAVRELGSSSGPGGSGLYRTGPEPEPSRDAADTGLTGSARQLGPAGGGAGDLDLSGKAREHRLSSDAGLGGGARNSGAADGDAGELGVPRAVREPEPSGGTDTLDPISDGTGGMESPRTAHDRLPGSSADGARSTDGADSDDGASSTDGADSADDVRFTDGADFADGVRFSDGARSTDGADLTDGVRFTDGAYSTNGGRDSEPVGGREKTDSSGRPAYWGSTSGAWELGSISRGRELGSTGGADDFVSTSGGNDFPSTGGVGEFRPVGGTGDAASAGRTGKSGADVGAGEAEVTGTLSGLRPSGRVDTSNPDGVEGNLRSESAASESSSISDRAVGGAVSRFERNRPASDFEVTRTITVSPAVGTATVPSPRAVVNEPQPARAVAAQPAGTSTSAPTPHASVTPNPTAVPTPSATETPYSAVAPASAAVANQVVVPTPAVVEMPPSAIGPASPSVVDQVVVPTPAVVGMPRSAVGPASTAARAPVVTQPPEAETPSMSTAAWQSDSSAAAPQFGVTPSSAAAPQSGVTALSAAAPQSSAAAPEFAVTPLSEASTPQPIPASAASTAPSLQPVLIPQSAETSAAMVTAEPAREVMPQPAAMSAAIATPAANGIPAAVPNTVTTPIATVAPTPAATPEPVEATTPTSATTPHPTTAPTSATTPHPTTAPTSATTPHPTTAPTSATTPQPATTLTPTTTSASATTLQPTSTPTSATTPQPPPTLTPASTPQPAAMPQPATTLTPGTAPTAGPVPTAVLAPVVTPVPAPAVGLSARIVELVAVELAGQVRENVQPGQWSAVVRRFGELLGEG
ncbi:UvrD-helicase domain-containing protein [Actinoplanes sp. M2I2]|uniref:UvrD-helicase domain-containing protein n=1 Tax=Actinoplanes sp. M2I2 TaxID=1734444 RepID=UPI0027E081CC|nr:UvrD-helicase domain-containing protein [Actinoplanes sp. M2I2]